MKKSLKKEINVLGAIFLFCFIISLSGLNVSAKENEDSTVTEEAKSYSDDIIVTPQIDRSDFTYLLGGEGSWGFIYGDNNWIGEMVRITNPNNTSINVIAYTEGGTKRGSYTIAAGESRTVGFFIWDGTYYFKVQYSDYSSGLLFLTMKTVG